MYYQLANNVDKISVDLLRSFDELPADEYLKSGHAFRYRAFGQATTKGDRVLWNDAGDFFQGTDINSYAGGIVRKFPVVGQATRDFAEALVADSRTRAVIPAEECQIGVHQIRIVADDEFNGYPTPEGFHQDGFDRVAITCVNQDNINGGVSMMSVVDDESKIIFDRVLVPGETVFLNDRAVKHYVSPVTPKLPGRASRDVIVVTFAEADG